MLTLNRRELSDLECLLDGSYAPLTGYMTQAEYQSVLATCRLANGSLWALPIVLHISTSVMVEITNQQLTQLSLRDETSLPVATLTISEMYRPDYEAECRQIYGTTDRNHPTVQRILQQDGYYVAGTVIPLQPIQHYDFLQYRLTPSDVRQQIQERGWTTIVGFQTRNPLHRSHVELTKLALQHAGPDAKLLLHPVVGETQECDIDYFTRCKCYEHVLPYYPDNTVLLALLPYSMRMGGPREALQHAIIRKTYGCTHFVVGRDHAGPSYKTQSGTSFYGPYDAQNFVQQYASELGIQIIALQNIQYIPDHGYFTEDRIPPELATKVQNLSGTELRSLLSKQLPIPKWYTYPEIAQELQKAYRLQTTGVCIYLVGLSGSGKSTIANALRITLLQQTDRIVSLLDGDVVRLYLSKGLGFSKADRSTNVRRIGYVASEIVKHGGVVICANIAPYAEDRQYNRQLISQYGRYIEVFVDTDLSTCEARDVKGLYRLAREGVLKEFTGISDPFERPEDADLVLRHGSIMEQVNAIMRVGFSS